MKAGSRIYFVLYIVIIVELLVVITERDRLLSEASAAIGKLKNLNTTQYTADLEIKLPEKEKVFVVPRENKDTDFQYFTANILTDGLISKSERDSAEFFAYFDTKTIQDFPFFSNDTISSGRDYFENYRFQIKKSEVRGVAKVVIKTSWIEIRNRCDNLVRDLVQNEIYKAKIRIYSRTKRIIDRSYDASTIAIILESLDTEEDNIEKVNKLNIKRFRFLLGIEPTTLSDLLLQLQKKNDNTRDLYTFSADYAMIKDSIENFRTYTRKDRETLKKLNATLTMNKKELISLKESDSGLSEERIKLLRNSIEHDEKELKRLMQVLLPFQQNLKTFYISTITESFIEYLKNSNAFESYDKLVWEYSSPVEMIVDIKKR